LRTRHDPRGNHSRVSERPAKRRFRMTYTCIHLVPRPRIALEVLALSIHTSDPITMSMTLAEHVSPLERGSIFRKARPRSPESREENEETGCYPCVARSLQSARLFAERIVTPESLPLLATLLRDEHRCCSSTRVTFRAGLLCAITCREIRSISRLDRGPTDHTEIRST